MKAEALRSDAVYAFTVFARHRNFTRAAEELHIAQPSLHAKVAKLSRVLGVGLYERVGRDLVLTDAGKALATYGADQQRAAEDLLAELDAPGRVLRIAAGRAALRWVLDGSLRVLARRGVDLQVTPADRAQALALLEAGDVDVAAVAYDPPFRHLRSHELARVPQILVGSSSAVPSSGAVELAELDGAGFVVPPAGRPHRQALERALDAAAIDWNVGAEADGWDLILQLVRLGSGVAIVNGCVPVPRPLRSAVVTDLPPVTYWLAWREPRQGAADLFLEAIDADG